MRVLIRHEYVEPKAYRQKCRKCGSLLEYQKEDWAIKIDEDMGMIDCPVCGHRMTASVITDDRVY